MRLHFKGRLLASHENIKLGCEWLEMTNALAYNINYTLKSFILHERSERSERSEVKRYQKQA